MSSLIAGIAANTVDNKKLAELMILWAVTDDILWKKKDFSNLIKAWKLCIGKPSSSGKHRSECNDLKRNKFRLIPIILLLLDQSSQKFLYSYTYPGF